MHLSTSSSDKVREAQLDRFTVVLLGAVLALLAAAEGVSVVGFDRTSKVQRRELSQRQVLLSVKNCATSGSARFAVLGNSLLLEGVDVALLAARTQPKFMPVPYFVLATEYYDWFFGLKSLFAKGMRPCYVVLGLSPNQFASSRTRGDYSARYLFQRTDLLEVARLTHMNATTASELVLSHFSKFYSAREVIRGYVQGLLLPRVTELLHNRLGTTRAPELDEATLKQLAAERLATLDRLCRANGARFMLVIPPTYQKGAETIARVGRDQRVTVLVPVAAGSLDPSYYNSDGFHLNNKGAQVFTTRLAADMLDELLK
jgi:hypothetical protein